MSRSQRFVAALNLHFVYQASLVLTGLWLTPFLLRHIGQHDYGVWLMLNQVLLYLALMDLGMLVLLPRDIAYATGKSEGAPVESEVSAVIAQTGRLVLYQMPFVIAVALGAWFLLPATWTPYKTQLALALAGFVILFPLRMGATTLEGLQDLVFLGRMQIASWVCSVVLTVTLTMAGWGLYAMLAGWAFGQVLSAIASFLRLSIKYARFLPTSFPHVPWNEARSRLEKCSWLTLAQLAHMFIAGSDLLVLGRVLGAVAVVPYSCTEKLIAVLGNQPQIVMQVATPGLSELRYNGSRERIFQVSAALAQGLLLLSGLIFCVVLPVNRWFVGWWVGAARFGGLPLTILLLINMVLRHWNTSFAYTIFCLGHERRISLTNLFDGSVKLSLAFLLSSRLGALAIPVASLGALLLVSIPFNLHALARDSGRSWWAIVAPQRAWIVRFAPMAILALAIPSYWEPAGILQAVLVAAAMGALYALVMGHMALNSALGVYVRPYLDTLKLGRLRVFIGAGV